MRRWWCCASPFPAEAEDGSAAAEGAAGAENTREKEAPCVTPVVVQSQPSAATRQAAVPTAAVDDGLPETVFAAPLAVLNDLASVPDIVSASFVVLASPVQLKREQQLPPPHSGPGAGATACVVLSNKSSVLYPGSFGVLRRSIATAGLSVCSANEVLPLAVLLKDAAPHHTVLPPPSDDDDQQGTTQEHVDLLPEAYRILRTRGDCRAVCCIPLLDGLGGVAGGLLLASRNETGPAGGGMTLSIAAALTVLRATLNSQRAAAVVDVMHALAEASSLRHLAWTITGSIGKLLHCCHPDDVEGRLVLLPRGGKTVQVLVRSSHANLARARLRSPRPRSMSSKTLDTTALAAGAAALEAAGSQSVPNNAVAPLAVASPGLHRLANGLASPVKSTWPPIAMEQLPVDRSVDLATGMASVEANADGMVGDPEPNDSSFEMSPRRWMPADERIRSMPTSRQEAFSGGLMSVTMAFDQSLTGRACRYPVQTLVLPEVSNALQNYGEPWRDVFMDNTCVGSPQWAACAVLRQEEAGQGASTGKGAPLGALLWVGRTRALEESLLQCCNLLVAAVLPAVAATVAELAAAQGCDTCIRAVPDCFDDCGMDSNAAPVAPRHMHSGGLAQIRSPFSSPPRKMHTGKELTTLSASSMGTAGGQCCEEVPIMFMMSHCPSTQSLMASMQGVLSNQRALIMAGSMGNCPEQLMPARSNSHLSSFTEPSRVNAARDRTANGDAMAGPAGRGSNPGGHQGALSASNVCAGNSSVLCALAQHDSINSGAIDWIRSCQTMDECHQSLDEERLEVLGVAGHGTYGDVFIGTWLGQVVAIKVVPCHADEPQPEGSSPKRATPDRDAMRIAWEVAVSCSLKHPYIVGVHKVWTDVAVVKPRGEPWLLIQAADRGAVMALEKDDAATVKVPEPPSHGNPEMYAVRAQVLAMEYCSLGSLTKYIREHRRTMLASMSNPGPSAMEQDSSGEVSSTASGTASNNLSLSSGVNAIGQGTASATNALTREWCLAPVLHLLAHVCEAFIHLEAQGVVHCDLKPDNVLLSRASAASRIPTGSSNRALLRVMGTSATTPATHHDDLTDYKNIVAKVADFGMAELSTRQGDLVGQRGGTLAYVSPEALLGQQATSAMDVFAFGVIMCELLTCSVPYSDSMRAIQHKLTRRQQAGGPPVTVPDVHRHMARAIIRHNARPTFPPDAPPTYVALARRCWDANPRLRPTFAEVGCILGEMQAAVRLGAMGL